MKAERTAPPRVALRSHPLTSDGTAALLLSLPEGAAPEPDDALPALAVPSLPGARIALRVGYRAGGVTVRAACMAAPANGWATGVEEIVLDRATQLAHEALEGEVAPFAVGDRTAVGPTFEQRFQGSVRRGGEALSLRGRHWLGFTGDPREAVVCTAMCAEPAPARECDALIAASRLGGTWTEAPPPSLLARTLLLSAEHPYEALGVAVTVSIAAAALIVARRPRP